MGDYTIREIRSQPEIWRAVLDRMRADSALHAMLGPYPRSGPVLFTGCGSSYYLGLAAAAAWTRFAGGPAFAVSATDLMTYPECHVTPQMPGTVVAISRSGKTVETRTAVDRLKKLGRLSLLRASRMVP
jgi:glucosamine--fructose-6-phosphate aminotransferase (isomerizing)